MTVVQNQPNPGNADDVTIDWYRSPLDMDTLRELTGRNDWRGLQQVILNLALIAATGAVSYYFLTRGPWQLAIVALFLHGTLYSFLSGVPVHELSHRTVFKTQWLNEFFLRLIAFMSWSNYVFFRTSHMKHHQYTLHYPHDMEVVLPLKLNTRTWIWSFSVNLWAIKYLIGGAIRTSFGVLKGEWEHKIFPQSDQKRRRALFNWARVLVVGHILLAAVFVWLGMWPWLLIVTFAPFFAGWLSLLCGFTQHAGMSPTVADFRLSCRSVKLNWIFAFLYWQMNYHVEHHTYAAVPFYRLKKLRSIIGHDLPKAQGLWKSWKQILYVLKKQKTDPNYVFVPELPSARKVGCAGS